MPAARWTHGFGRHNKMTVKMTAGMRNRQTKAKPPSEKPVETDKAMTKSTKASTMIMRLNVHGAGRVVLPSVSFASIVEPPSGSAEPDFQVSLPPAIDEPLFAREPTIRQVHFGPAAAGTNPDIDSSESAKPFCAGPTLGEACVRSGSSRAEP